MDFSRIKAFAKSKVKEQFGMALLLTLIIDLCIGLAASTPISAFAALLIAAPFSLSLINIYVSILAGEKPEFKEAFSGFSNWWATVKVAFFQGLYTFLWSLLFVIPGIVKAFAYSQAMYILSEKPNMSAHDALRESERLMKGNKMRFFFFQLSFIGWWFLVGLTFGLAAIWVIPYYNACLATFYIDIRPSSSSSDDSSASASTNAQTTSSGPNKTITFGNGGNNGGNQK